MCASVFSQEVAHNALPSHAGQGECKCWAKTMTLQYQVVQIKESYLLAVVQEGRWVEHTGLAVAAELNLVGPMYFLLH